MRAKLARVVAAGGVCSALASGCAGLFQVPGPETVARDPGWWVAPGVELVHQQGPADCGASALATLLTRWEPGNPAAELRQSLGASHRPGVKAAELRALVRARALQSYLIEGTADDLARELEHGRPVLVGLAEYSGKRMLGHYAVVVGLRRDRTRVMLADPDRGWRNITVEAFELEWRPTARLALVVLPPAHLARE
jgi:ABC-type bacteriocin/lantibiotic exporter with double-glycine peptidase domain